MTSRIVNRVKTVKMMGVVDRLMVDRANVAAPIKCISR